MRCVAWFSGVAFLIGLLVNGLISVEAQAPSPGDVKPPELRVRDGKPLDQVSALFERTEGWTGADGAHSVALGPGKTLWLFSDTWVGGIRQGKRFDATIVNNSVALQEGSGAEARIRFVVQRGTDGKPTALITPVDQRGWFWLQAGIVVDNRLHLFLTQVEKTGAPGVFGFRQIGQWLGVVANYQDDPTSWRVEQQRVPHTIFSPAREVTFGAALLRAKGFVYIYGTDEDIKPASRSRHLIVARAPATRVADFASWEFYGTGVWQRDFRKASRLVPGMASDCSVTWMPSRRQYVLVYTEGGLSERILARTAAHPWGPWSEPVTVFRCPEMGWDQRIFCYNAKAHETLATSDNELTISYVANSFDFWHVAADARLYWPRFVRVRLMPRQAEP